MNNRSDLSFGFDLGVSSIGWAVYNQEKNTILDKGVVEFSQASSAEDRRTARSSRRRLRREKHRIERLEYLFSKSNLVYENKIQTNLLELRIKSLNEKIEINEILNIICYFARHRGYIPYKDDNRDTNEFVETLRAQGMLPCHMQKELLKANNKYRGILNNVFKNEEYIAELKVILNTQKEFYKTELTDSFIEKVIEILESKRKFWEGPGNHRANALTPYGRYKTFADLKRYEEDNNYNKYLFEELIGECSVYAGEKKTTMHNFYAEKFNFLNDFMNLKFDPTDVNENSFEYFEQSKKEKEFYRLNIKGIKKIEDRILNSEFGKKIGANSILKELYNIKPSKGYKIDSDSDKDESDDKAKVSTFNDYRKIKNKISDERLFNELTSDINVYNKAVYIMQVSPSTESREEMLRDSLEISEELINILKLITLENKYHSFSEKALKTYINLMETYNENSSYIENKYALDINADSTKKLVENYLNENIKEGNLKYISDKYINNLIASPQVKKTLKRSILLINKLFSKYGYPKYVCIETTESLMNQEKQKEYQKQMLSNTVKRNNAKKKLEESGFDASEQNIVKYLLLKETGEKCTYCGKDITVSNSEVQHVLPISISLDDSFNNKVAICTECNAKLGNKTTHEYLISLGLYDTFKKKIQNNNEMSDRKKGYLLFEGDISKYEKKFKNSNLNDTAYATKEFANQIKIFKEAHIMHNFGEILDMDVLKIPGQYTATIRQRANLEKDRAEKYHHAVDASIIATIPYIKLGKLMNIVQNDADKFWKHSKIDEYRDTVYNELYLNKEIKEELSKASFSNTRFSKEIKKSYTSQLANADVISTIQKEDKILKINQYNNIYEMKNDDIKKMFENSEKGTDRLLCQDKDVKLFNKLKNIFEKYKDNSEKMNPFIAYSLEILPVQIDRKDFNPDVHGIKRNDKKNAPIIKTLRYYQNVNNPYILYKASNERKKLMLDGTSQYCTRIYRDKETGKLLFLPINHICLNPKTKEINENASYYKDLYNAYVGKPLESIEFYMDVFNGEYLRFINKDGSVSEGYYQTFHKSLNKLLVVNCNKSIVRETKEIKKIKMDILGLYNINVT